MAFWDDLGDSLTGTASNDLAKKQLELQQQALNADAKQNNTALIIGVIFVVLAICGAVLYFTIKPKN